MIDLRKINAVTTIVTHEGCPDGIASAMILKDALPSARVVFVRYGSPEMAALVAEPGLLFCDIAPPPERAHEFVAAGAIVLDHHKTAREVVKLFGDNGVFADEKLDPYDSGAVLAFREIWAQTRALRIDVTDQELRTVRRLADLAGIRDLWHRKDELWGAACEQAEALRFYPADVLVGSHPLTWPTFLGIGSFLVAKREETVRRLIGEACRFDIGDVRVVVIASTETDDVMDAIDLRDDRIIVAGFAYRCDNAAPKLRVSLRGRGVDVSAIAQRYGGGGHTNAAGFTVSLSDDSANPYASIGLALGVALL